MVGTSLHGDDISVHWHHIPNIQGRIEWVVGDDKLWTEHEQPR